nr:MAG TPA: hypothetical protein [Bacteriophage sp.]
MSFSFQRTISFRCLASITRYTSLPEFTRMIPFNGKGGMQFKELFHKAQELSLIARALCLPRLDEPRVELPIFGWDKSQRNNVLPAPTLIRHLLCHIDCFRTVERVAQDRLPFLLIDFLFQNHKISCLQGYTLNLRPLLENSHIAAHINELFKQDFIRTGRREAQSTSGVLFEHSGQLLYTDFQLIILSFITLLIIGTFHHYDGIFQFHRYSSNTKGLTSNR